MTADYRKRLESRIAELRSRIGGGGLRECLIRALLYVGMSRGMVDERGLEALRRVRKTDAGPKLTLAQFKSLVREQFFMLLLEPEASLAAIPKLLPQNVETRRRGLEAIRDVLSASAEVSDEAASRLRRVTELFGVTDESRSEATRPPFDSQARAS
jgi:hypothetical protein